jgi:hypothetical protein
MANYVAAILIVAAVALFVAAPLSGGFPRRRRATSDELDRERLEHDRGLAVQGLRELEFDHAMGKLDETDYRDLKRSLENRALAAMSAIERLRGGERATMIRLASRPLRPAPAVVPVAPAALASIARPSSRRALGASSTMKPIVNFCPQCGVAVGADHNFCAGCGASLNVVASRTASRAE